MAIYIHKMLKICNLGLFISAKWNVYQTSCLLTPTLNDQIVDVFFNVDLLFFGLLVQ